MCVRINCLFNGNGNCSTVLLAVLEKCMEFLAAVKRVEMGGLGAKWGTNATSDVLVYEWAPRLHYVANCWFNHPDFLSFSSKQYREYLLLESKYNYFKLMTIIRVRCYSLLSSMLLPTFQNIPLVSHHYRYPVCLPNVLITL